MSKYFIEKTIPSDMPLYAIRIAKLMEEKQMTNAELANKADIPSASTIHKILKNKNFSPSMLNIINIANVFNVSVDYLVGNTNVPSRNANIQQICNYTGLTEKEIKFLNNIKNKKTSQACSEIYATHALLGNEHLLELIGNYLTANYESEHNGIWQEPSDNVAVFNKYTKQNEIINCRYIPFLFLRAIESELNIIKEAETSVNY